ncbi:MAG: 3-methyl-2-oxobutanoate hydroxymethyltransferase, partial [Clostridia bacterium]|nr:3-methyl-2-oxobutanoate hydroxymethyltransferase [Clostridia bacterium]
VLGYETTLPVTMDEMIHHTKAVCRGAKNALVVGDMPFLSYHCSIDEAVFNAGRFLKEAGAQAVKLEGGEERKEVTKALVAAGIPVVGHIGLTPQSVHQMGGFKVQGKNKEQAKKLIDDAKALEKAGAFGLVLECVPAPLAQLISNSIAIPTIGIGAGAGCSGQVLVWHDLLGITQDMKPRFVKQYANLHEETVKALKLYKDEVEKGSFPGKEHSFTMKEEDIPKIY